MNDSIRRIVLVTIAVVILSGAAPAQDNRSSAARQSPRTSRETDRQSNERAPNRQPRRPRVIISPPIRDPDRLTRTHVMSWKAIREQNIVMQQHDYSCGAAALATLLRYYWGERVTEEMVLVAILKELTEEEIKDRMENGLSITDLRKVAEALGYPAALGKMTMSKLMEAKAPVIVRTVEREFEHFVVYRGVVDDRVFLADPIRGNVRMSVVKFMGQWLEKGKNEGVVLVVAKEGVEELPKEAPLLVRHPRGWSVVPELQGARRGLHLLSTPPPGLP